MNEQEVKEYGQSIQFNPLETTIEEQREILDRIIGLACNALPRGTIFEIIEKQYTPITKFYKQNFGRELIPFTEYIKNHGVAWYHISTMTYSKPLFNGRLGVWPEGNEIVARLIAAGPSDSFDYKAQLDERSEIPVVENV